MGHSYIWTPPSPSGQWTEKGQRGSWETSEVGLLSKGETGLVGMGAMTLSTREILQVKLAGEVVGKT